SNYCVSPHPLHPPLFSFINDTATTEIYTLSLHDALPIYSSRISLRGRSAASLRQNCVTVFSFSKNHFSSPSGRWSIENEKTVTQDRKSGSAGMPRPISYAVFCLKKKRRQLRPWQSSTKQPPA